MVNYTSTSTFKKDLKFSQEGENELKTFFENKNYKVSTTQDLGLFAEYDLSVTVPTFGEESKTYTIEYKNDRKCVETGNFVTEIWKTIDGENLPAGLSASRADYWVIKLGKSTTYRVINRLVFRKYVLDNFDNITKFYGGDGGKSYLILLPIKELLKITKELK